MTKTILAAGMIGFLFFHAFCNGYVELERWSKEHAVTPVYQAAVKKLGLQAIPPLIPAPPPKTLRQIIREEAEEQKLNPAVAFAIVDIESRWEPTAVSEAGALGLMQVMPQHAKSFCGLASKSELLIPEKNAHCGIKVFNELRTKHSDLYTVLRIYNCGYAAVSGRCKKAEEYIQKFNKALMSETN